MNNLFLAWHFGARKAVCYLTAFCVGWLAFCGAAFSGIPIEGSPVESRIVQTYGHGHGMGDFSADGRWYAQPGENNDIEVWDNWPGALTRRIAGHAGEVRKVCFSPDGSQLVSIAADNTLRRWDFATGAELGRIELNSTPKALDVNASGTLAVTGEASGAFHVWSLATGALLSTATVQKGAVVRGAAFSPDSSDVCAQFLYPDPNSAFCLDQAQFVNWSTGKLTGSTSGSPFYGYGADSHHFFRYGGLYDMGGNLVWQPKDWFADKTGPLVIDQARYLPRSRRTLISSNYYFDTDYFAAQNQARLYDEGSTQTCNVFANPRNSMAGPLKVSNDESLLMFFTADGHIYTWDMNNGGLLRDCQVQNDFITAVRCSPDGKWVATGGRYGDVILYDAQSGEEKYRLTSFTPYFAYPEFDGVVNLCFSRDGRFFAAGNRNGRERVLDLNSGQVVLDCQLNTAYLEYGIDADITPSNRLAVITNHRVVILDGKTTKTINLTGHSIRALDDDRLLIKTTQGLVEYQISTGKTLKSLALEFSDYGQISLSLDHSRIVLCLSYTYVYVINWNEPSVMQKISLNMGDIYNRYDSCEGAEISPDGRFFLLNVINSGVYWVRPSPLLFSTDTGNYLQCYKAPEESSSCPTFSGDGRRVLAAQGGRVFAFDVPLPTAIQNWTLYQ